eukprot:scaffold4545_cov111-Isochrysis_galbana.AAC.19
MEPRQRRGSHRRGRLHPRTGCGGRHIAGRRAPLRLPPGQHELGGRGDAHRPGRPRRHRRADPFAGRRQRHRLGLRRLHFLPRRAGGLLCRGPHCRHHRPPPDHPAQAEHLHAGLAARGAQCHARLRHAPLHRSRPRLPPNAGWACHLRRGMRCHNRRGANVPRRDLAAPPARRPGHVLPADVLHGHPARPDPRPSRRLRPRALVGRLPAAASPPRGRTVGTSGPSGGEPPLAGEPDRRRGYAGAAGAGPLARGERRQPGRHPGARHDADELGRGVRPAGRRQGHRHHARPAEDAQGPPDLCRVRHRTAGERGAHSGPDGAPACAAVRGACPRTRALRLMKRAAPDPSSKPTFPPPPRGGPRPARPQFSGINNIFNFSTIFLTSNGIAASTVALIAVLMNIGNVGITVLSVELMDRSGRRFLLLASTVGMVVSLLALTLALSEPGQAWTPPLAVASVVGFVMSFGIGMGPVPWLLPAELFAADSCAKGAALSAGTNWLANFVVGQAFLPLANVLKSAVFLPFAAVLCAFFFFVKRSVPGTRAKTLEQILQELA